MDIDHPRSILNMNSMLQGTIMHLFVLCDRNKNTNSYMYKVQVS